MSLLCIVQVKGTDMTFESPSAFSIFLKRLINPARKADDGWKTVKFGGKFLEAYKIELARRRFGGGVYSGCKRGRQTDRLPVIEAAGRLQGLKKLNQCPQSVSRSAWTRPILREEYQLEPNIGYYLPC